MNYGTERIFLKFIIILTIIEEFINALYTSFLHDLTLLAEA